MHHLHNNLQKLNIHARNLTAFGYADGIIPIVLGESLNISKAMINLFSSSDCFDYVFCELVDTLSHVQSLSVNFEIETEVQAFPKSPSRLTYLRPLVLKTDVSGWPETTAGILRLAYLLELVPVLEECIVVVSAFIIWELRDDALSLCPQNHLKTLRMTGVYGFHG
ncbi:hypothetical protein ACP70R_010687 [Stipagrostis hirtigluma subsp. patula]